MKFSGREDISAPVGDVFARLTDFKAHENAVMRRGVQVQRIDGLETPGPGMTWAAKVKFRGKVRSLQLVLDELCPNELAAYQLEGSGLSGTFDLDLLSLSKRRTRLAVALEIRPKNLTGRLLMQSLRILKPTLNRRFKVRIAEYGRVLGGLPPDDIG